MLNLFELPELIDLLTGKKREPEPAGVTQKKVFYGAFFFGLVGAGLGAKLASKGEFEPTLEYALMTVAALIGYLIFFKVWRKILG
ncbi:hypothetical protein LP7551_03485 [Roseibium album]|nr:hypothetical protein LP7551_03485 [Roseibium album]